MTITDDYCIESSGREVSYTGHVSNFLNDGTFLDSPLKIQSRLN